VNSWVAAYGGDLESSVAHAEDALRHFAGTPAASHEIGAFVADVEESRGNFSAAAKRYETILAAMSEGYTPPGPELPFFYPESIALRLHHTYSISGATSAAAALAARYGVVTARVGIAWPPESEWIVAGGVCTGVAPGRLPYSLDDSPELVEQAENCVNQDQNDRRVLVSLLFSPDGKVLAAEGAAIQVDRDRLECACRTAMQAKLYAIGEGLRSRHLESLPNRHWQTDYRGM
jgi:hypothetical protein